MTKTIKDHKTFGVDTNEKRHKPSQLMLDSSDPAQEIRELIDALRKIGYFQSFQVKENHIFSSEKPQKRRLKPKKRAEYRLIKHYYKSRKQYVKERIRRKLCWLLSAKYKQSEIADMLGVSRRTVIRDMNKIKPYYFRLARSYFTKLEQERIKEFQAKLEGKSEFEKLHLLTQAMIEQHEQFKAREYRSHYRIIYLDLTQVDTYGIPKLSIIPRHIGKRTLAFPYKIKVVVKGNYEGREFEADIGSIELTQTAGGW